MLLCLKSMGNAELGRLQMRRADVCKGGAFWRDWYRSPSGLSAGIGAWERIDEVDADDVVCQFLAFGAIRDF